MAVTAEGRAVTEAHRRLQVRVAALTVLQMRVLWRLIDPEDLESTIPDWTAASVRLIRQQHQVSSQIAERYLQQFRQAEIGQALTGTLPRPGLSDEAVRTSLLVTGPFKLLERLRKGMTLERALAMSVAGSAAAAARHALNGGRGTLTAAVAQDRQAIGWVRVTSDKPCAFCALLASRGPVYKSRESAVRGKVFSTAVMDFRAHDSCMCTAEPMYSNESEWPNRGREWADLYADVARGQPDPLNAFRRAYEAA